MSTKSLVKNTSYTTKDVGFPPSGPVETSKPVVPSTARRVFTIEKLIDFANDPALAGSNQAATTDVLQLLNIKNVVVLGVFANVLKATGLTSTCIVGDGNDDNGWITSVNLNTTGPVINNGAYVAAGGKLYTTEDTLDITLTITSGPATKGQLLITVLCMDPM